MTSATDLRPILPVAMVCATGLVILLVQAFTARGRRRPMVEISLVGLLAAFVSLRFLWLDRGVSSFGGVVASDRLAVFLQVTLLAIGAGVVLLSPAYLRETHSDRGEHYALVLFSLAGMMGLVSAVDLVSLFLALETMSIALYALAGMRRDRAESQEAAVKYFLTGAFASAFLLYGIALVYGVSGTTRLNGIAGSVAGLLDPAREALATGQRPLALLGIGMLLVGFGFKIASVPFHMWVPDVYEGAPTPVTAFMAAGVKAAAFGALLRVTHSVFELAPLWQGVVAALAVASMVGGNLGALGQRNVKRMLAFSSVAHAGYLLTALVARPHAAAEAVVFYLVAYGAANLGAFGALAALARDGREPSEWDDFAGLAGRRPVLAAALALFMISLTGVPISAGFIGKFQLFKAAVGAGWAWLAVVGVVMSLLSAYYYLRLVVVMYMREPRGEDDFAKVGVPAGVAIVVAAAVILGLGLAPQPILAFAREAGQVLYLASSNVL